MRAFLNWASGLIAGAASTLALGAALADATAAFSISVLIAAAITAITILANRLLPEA